MERHLDNLRLSNLYNDHIICSNTSNWASYHGETCVVQTWSRVKFGLRWLWRHDLVLDLDCKSVDHKSEMKWDGLTNEKQNEGDKFILLILTIHIDTDLYLNRLSC